MKQQTAAERVAESLREPQQKHRPIPFWSWNEKLHPDELRRQIRMMAHSGVGGYFMHARSGLETEYLEQPWFDSVQTGIEEGQAVGLTPWIYDEEGWPSGFAGGKVTAKGDWVYARGLRMRRIASPDEAVTDSTLLGVFACTENDAEAVPLAQAEPGRAYVSYVEMTHSSSPFYVDVMNKDVMREFLNETHERYAERFALGKDGLAGFFTDEPRFSEGPIPWSYLLPDEFAKRYGYDLMEFLPALYLPCGNYRKVRHDFWAMTNDLFVNAYMKQIGEWCEAHNCLLTGHMMMEESLYSQMTGTGGGMPFYEFMQQPGVDSLRRNVNDPRIPKQVGSVAEQLGKKTVLTESYAMSGWDLNFDEMRWIAGWQFVNGVNLLCQHLQAYSLKGSRKRDYPPSLYYQQTWYDEYHRFNDAAARLGQLLGEGQKEIEVLLIHPMHSGWISYDGTNNDEIRALDEEFIRACELLSGAHIDYHLGDEVILRRHGKVLADGRIRVGNYTYGAVVVPDCLTLDRTTLRMLEAFTSAGHPLVRLGRWPQLCEGEESAEIRALESSARFAETAEELHTLLDGIISRNIRIRENGAECMPIHCCQVSAEGGTALFVVNMDRTVGHNTVVTLAGSVRPERLEPDTLEHSPLAARLTPEGTEFALPLRPMETALIIFEDGEPECLAEAAPSSAELCGGAWRVREIGDNALTLDACEYQIDGGAWQPKKAVIHLMQDLLDLQRACDIRQRFTFTLRCAPQALTRLYFVMEQPHPFVVTVNGTPVTFPAPEPVFDPQHKYKDISLYKTDILPLVRTGENVIELSARFAQSQHVYDVLYGENVYETELNKLTYDMELESVYLLGNFGVYSLSEFVPGMRRSLITDGPFVLDTLPETLDPGDFTAQGLTFFADVLTVEKTFTVPETEGRIVLDLGAPRAGLVQARVDGGEPRTFLWAPYTLDFTGLAPGEHTLTVTLYASNRNLFGPHHHKSQENYSVGPLSFTGKFSWADRESEAVAITPEMRLQNFWTDSYSFVTFGL